MSKCFPRDFVYVVGFVTLFSGHLIQFGRIHAAESQKPLNELQTKNRLHLLSRWVLVFFLWILLISMANGNFGILHYLKLLHGKQELESKMMILQVKNQFLEQRLEELMQKSDRTVIALKSKDGLIEKNARIYHFLKTPPKQFVRKEPKHQISVRNRPTH